jgi:hypothetical protein
MKWKFDDWSCGMKEDVLSFPDADSTGEFVGGVTLAWDLAPPLSLTSISHRLSHHVLTPVAI